ncbi:MULTISPECIES: IclR family transcriptional regulator [Microbacterium]|uniref:DNA-binding transcriptional regulator, IclR family n=1 Tax=Microbacterium saccharophilum TaxID=1213358 RepID=A0A7Z7D493_9MICO|nr:MULTISPECIES: IclR family transcriptional regulator [Microbacterium]SFI78039.1 DNA-binding transcriptional regulator, IclR family [Microbacterium saccharophilum]
MSTNTRDRDTRTAVDKAISVVTAFGRDAHVGVGVSELARRSNLSKSTTFRLLGMLERNGVVERAGTAYRLGRVIQELGAMTSTPDHERIRDLFTPFLADLYEATHLTVQLAVLNGTNVVYLNKLEGHNRLRTPSRIGGRMPAYCTAVGKLLLAYESEALEATLAAPRPAWTPSTIVDETQLRSELWQVRQRGVSIDRGESLESLSCLAAPIMGTDGKPIAALSVSGDAATFRPEVFDNVIRRVCFAAARAAVSLRFSSRAA